MRIYLVNGGNEKLVERIPKYTNIRIEDDLGRPFITIDDKAESTPELLFGLVKEVSLYSIFSTDHESRRKTGIYKDGDTRAELDFYSSGDATRFRYELRIKGKTVEDVHTLYCKIKSGSILPVESYEAPQRGKSRAELEAEFKRKELELKNLETAYQHFKDELREFCEMLSSEKLLLCTKGRIIRKISGILSEH